MSDVLLFCQFNTDEFETLFFSRNDLGQDNAIYVKLSEEIITVDGERVNAVSLGDGEPVNVDDDETVIPISLSMSNA